MSVAVEVEDPDPDRRSRVMELLDALLRSPHVTPAQAHELVELIEEWRSGADGVAELKGRLLLSFVLGYRAVRLPGADPSDLARAQDLAAQVITEFETGPSSGGPGAPDAVAHARTWAAMLTLLGALGQVPGGLQAMADLMTGGSAQALMSLGGSITDGLDIDAFRSMVAGIDVEDAPELAGVVGAAAALGRILGAGDADDDVSFFAGMADLDKVVPQLGTLPPGLMREMAMARATAVSGRPEQAEEWLRATAALEAALHETETNDERAALLLKLGRMLLMTVIGGNDPDTLRRAREVTEEALALLPDGHPRHAEALGTFGMVGVIAVATGQDMADSHRAHDARAALAAAAAAVGPDMEMDDLGLLMSQTFATVWESVESGDTTALDPQLDRLIQVAGSLRQQDGRNEASEAHDEVVDGLLSTIRMLLLLRGNIRQDGLDGAVAAGLPRSDLSRTRGQGLDLNGLLQLIATAQELLPAYVQNRTELETAAGRLGDLLENAPAQLSPVEEQLHVGGVVLLAFINVLLGIEDRQSDRVRQGLELAMAAVETHDPAHPMAEGLVGIAGGLLVWAASSGIVATAETEVWFARGLGLLRESDRLWGQSRTRPEGTASTASGFLARALFDRHVRTCDIGTASDATDLAEADDLLSAVWATGLRGTEPHRAAGDGFVLARLLRARAGHEEDPVVAAQLRARSRETGLTVLRLHGRGVLLQTGTERALTTARAAADRARAVTGWALEDGDLAAAVEALEVGRGLVLAAATSGDAIGRLLSGAGRGDLGVRWAEARDREPLPSTDVDATFDFPVMVGALAAVGAAPADLSLRHRVLTAVDAIAPDWWWSQQAAADDVVATVRIAGAQALAYFVPGDDNAPGAIVVVRPDGHIQHIAAPALTTGPASPAGRFLAAVAGDGQRHAHTPTPSELDAICDWAWTVGVGPLLDAVDPDGNADPERLRIVLVPIGPLAVVPWHAALAPGGDRLRACMRAVITSAASARELGRAAQVPQLPWEAGLLAVADPTGNQPITRRAAIAVRRELHPVGRLLGRARGTEGPALPVHVLDALPGPGAHPVAVLDLAAHARSAADPSRTVVLLDPETAPLTLVQILDHALQRHEGAPGGLVLLQACSSALSVADQDEALTLASGILAAGARAIIGTGWPVQERATAVFAYVLHHHLAGVEPGSVGPVMGDAPVDPALALARTQRWMLKQDWDAGTVQGAASSAFLRVHATPLTNDVVLSTWAAFRHHGG
jgi:hypothetical protein